VYYGISFINIGDSRRHFCLSCILFHLTLWITAQFSNVKVGLFELVFMRIRKVPPGIIVGSMITAIKAGLM
jgi:uncharacterized protein YqfA (UPF0365 family)